MVEVMKGLFSVATYFWNVFIDISVNLFTTSPKTAADGQLYTVVKTFYDAIIDCTIPLATVFFIIAIYKSVISTPPDQQPRRFMQDALKYVIILYISTQLWNVMGYIVDFADGITSAVTVSAEECHLDLTDSALFTEIESIDNDDDDDSESILTVGAKAYFKNWFNDAAATLMYLIGGVITILVMVAAGVSVINVAFQRIIKPLIIMPFSAIVLGIGSCSGEGSRMLWHFGKSFLGFCLSGAFMVLAVKLGNSLCTAVITPAISGSDSAFQNAIILIVQINLTALVVAGLCKAMDGMVGKVFG